ncbi:MAG: alcohol dehydrogenase [Verrucomicrobiaceae bacterium]|nr:MAG: alcohol dehydrogenase [Verrucomicrobiaceae bacterium]
MNTTSDTLHGRAAVFSGSGNPFELRHFPIPHPVGGEILVRVTCSTICGSDLHTWHGRRQEPTPCVLGHEIVGTIIDFGHDALREDLRGVTLEKGDRITWTLAASCGDCFYCIRGLPQKCETLFKYGHSRLSPGGEFSGGFAEYCLLRQGTGLIRLPDDLPDALAAPANCAVATVAAACRLAGDLRDSSVLVLGCGVLGLTAIAMAVHCGAEEVIACDLDERRGPMAVRFGATHFCAPGEVLAVSREASCGRGVDVAMEFSGAASAAAAAIEALRTGGTAVIAGTTTPGGKITIDPNDLVRRMLVIKGLHNYAPEDLVAAMDFLVACQDKVPFSELQGETFGLSEIGEAFESSDSNPGRRTVVMG